MRRCATSTAPTKTVVRRRSSRQSNSTNRSSMCVRHCRFWKRPSQVMNLAPHEHEQTGPERSRTLSRRSSTRLLTIASRRRDKSHSPSGDETKQSRSLRFDSETKWWIPVVQQRTDNGEQMPQEQFQRVKQKQNPSPERSEEERGTLTQAATAWSIGCPRYEIRER